MKDKLYTIPVNDAFDKGGECPLCNMIDELEQKAIDFTMGPSYMEDDVRGETSRLGFCERHIELLYKNQNRLGLSLIIKSHMDKIINDVEKLSANDVKTTVPSLFKKHSDNFSVADYIEKLSKTCYICSKIDSTFERYIATVFYLYQHEEEFRMKFKDSRGFCTRHYSILYKEANKHLSGRQFKEFIEILNSLYLNNMKRVRDDLEWFINKFDYRYANEPWKNSKDALPRAIKKTNSISLD
ncbi:hypothetical protein DFR55_11912 [Herbinix hemicellulosilytica]|uniref:ABC transporter substrate-binding protein n=1 Tax=Herbinix hemicellulosilytica TaxID=1564487 RepID=A0A0H5SDC5_HERHM|nr:DUF6062 family protein [Herbinix hemicellulosilytica]RBP57744.1 hypothetical protein DFR55_11912 [Herbinix hemicellulosilytica]CRZ33424.1 hypothetical protein HHT355_0212 [Herbinix hemicellulosilytica]